jgi:hypothetical protein
MNAAEPRSPMLPRLCWQSHDWHTYLPACVPEQQQAWHLQVTLDVCPGFGVTILNCNVAVIRPQEVGPVDDSTIPYCQTDEHVMCSRAYCSDQQSEHHMQLQQAEHRLHLHINCQGHKHSLLVKNKSRPSSQTTACTALLGVAGAIHTKLVLLERAGHCCVYGGSVAQWLLGHSVHLCGCWSDLAAGEVNCWHTQPVCMHAYLGHACWATPSLADTMTPWHSAASGRLQHSMGTINDAHSMPAATHFFRCLSTSLSDK